LARAYTKDGTFITAFYAVLDPKQRTLTYSVAGHNPPRLVRGTQIISLADHSALPMGIAEGEEYRQAPVAVERGDLLLLYTDGITEARAAMDASGSRELFGNERLDELLLNCEGRSPEG